MRLWVTKYALTKGVFLSAEGHETTAVSGYFKEDKPYGMFLRIDRDAFESREDAEIDAKARAFRKVKSLEKQVAKVRALADKPRFVEG